MALPCRVAENVHIFDSCYLNTTQDPSDESASETVTELRRPAEPAENLRSFSTQGVRSFRGRPGHLSGTVRHCGPTQNQASHYLNRVVSKRPKSIFASFEIIEKNV